MCGLVSVITKHRSGFNTAQKDAMSLLLFIDTLRGEDSTGTFLVTNEGNVHIAKEASDGPDFVRSNTFNTLGQKAWQNGWAWVGHNRKATRGSITDANAHPFWVDDKIVLVHNGTVYGDHKKIKDTEVDSEAIAHSISEAGNTNDGIAKALKTINAAYALIWYNVEDKSLNIIRNPDRPLYAMETDDAWYFASEEIFLEFISGKLSLKIKTKPYLLDDYTLVKLALKDDKSFELENFKLDCKFEYGGGVQRGPFPPFQRNLMHGGWGMCGEGYGDWEGEAFDPTGPAQAERSPATALISMTPSPTIRGTENIVVKQCSDEKPEIHGKVIETLYPNQKVHKFHEYEKNYSKEYTAGKKIRVIIDDIMMNHKDGPLMMLGRTMDSDGLHVTFPLDQTKFDNLHGWSDTAIFEIECDGISWKRTNFVGSTNMQFWDGMILVHGKNPVQLIENNGEYSPVQ